MSITLNTSRTLIINVKRRPATFFKKINKESINKERKNSFGLDDISFCEGNEPLTFVLCRIYPFKRC